MEFYVVHFQGLYLKVIHKSGTANIHLLTSTPNPNGISKSINLSSSGSGSGISNSGFSINIPFSPLSPFVAIVYNPNALATQIPNLINIIKNIPKVLFLLKQLIILFVF
ncbi:MAG: hypothetical protein [Circular genetic element sp.]|nr:MAG: hypothetical protein [Circular genetic element sp.]